MITDVNPFIYSHPIAPEDIIDRDEETKRLLTAAVGGHFVRLYAPRKYGKTSLLRRVLRDGERQERMIPILVDLYGVLSIADVAIRFERAYSRQLKGKVRARVEEFLQSTGLGLSLGALGISARLQLDPRTDPLPALHALLDLPLRLEEGGGFRALIVLDEFQDITKVKQMDAILRSHIQFQGEVASFVFAGSEPGLMRGLFEDRERPLYGQAVPMRLARLADPDIAAYIIARFRETGRSVGDALNPLLGSAQGHPQRAMLLAHRLWEEVAPRPPRRSRTGRVPTPPRSPSSSRSSTRTGAGSRRTRRRRCAPSSPAPGSPFQKTRARATRPCRRAPPVRPSQPSSRTLRLRSGASSTSWSTRCSPSGSRISGKLERKRSAPKQTRPRNSPGGAMSFRLGGRS